MISAWLMVLAMLAAEPPKEDVDKQFEKTKADEAVEKALEYLAKQQKQDGSFPDGYGGTTGISSLCVMAFLANGHTPDTGRYQEIVRKGLDFVLSHQHENGIITNKTSHGPMYCHGISTLMLCEVYGMTDNEQLKKKLDKAIDLILKSQKRPKNERDRGGWRYNADSNDSDISCTGWQLMSLRAAKNDVLEVPKAAIAEGVRYVARCFHRPSGGFSYQPGGPPNMGRTGTGMLSLQVCGEYEHEALKPAAEYLMREKMPRWGGEHFFYAIYYASQGMFQCGGKHWEYWQPRLEELLVKQQNADGSWPNASGGNEEHAGGCYRTSMAVLALSIQYRYLPIYQR